MNNEQNRKKPRNGESSFLCVSRVKIYRKTSTSKLFLSYERVKKHVLMVHTILNIKNTKKKIARRITPRYEITQGKNNN